MSAKIILLELGISVIGSILGTLILEALTR